VSFDFLEEEALFVCGAFFKLFQGFFGDIPLSGNFNQVIML